MATWDPHALTLTLILTPAHGVALTLTLAAILAARSFLRARPDAPAKQDEAAAPQATEGAEKAGVDAQKKEEATEGAKKKCGPITVKPLGTELSDVDIVLVNHLFAGEVEVEMRRFGAGFSGCDVYGCKSKTRDVPGLARGTLPLAECVVKLGPSEMVLAEAHKLEAVRQVLGNSCPSLLSRAEHRERAGIRTGYASFTGISSSLGDVLKSVASTKLSRNSAKLPRACSEWRQRTPLEQFQTAVRQIFEETWAPYYKSGVDVMVEMFSVSGFLKPKDGSMGDLDPGPDGFPYAWIRD